MANPAGKFTRGWLNSTCASTDAQSGDIILCFRVRWHSQSNEHPQHLSCTYHHPAEYFFSFLDAASRWDQIYNSGSKLFHYLAPNHSINCKVLMRSVQSPALSCNISLTFTSVSVTSFIKPKLVPMWLPALTRYNLESDARITA
jgi:hypothetical protein